ncbi:MAG TPA: transketolase C-terminal domain-containing protein, partial [bacterium]
MRKACLDEIYRLAKRDERVVFFGSDIGAGTLDNFRREMPERFFMEGVSEQNIVGVMSGMAMSGRIPYLNTIAVFLTRRCYEQVLLDAAMHRLPIRLCGSGGGVVYAPLGSTHLAFDDLALMRAIPGMTIVAPCDAEEMRRLVPLTADWEGPMYIRFGKGGDPVVSDPAQPFRIGKGILLHGGADALLVTTGITLRIALEARRLLAGEGVSAAVLHLHTVKPLDAGALLEAAAPVRAVVTIEEHNLVGGLGSAVAEVLAEERFGVPKGFRRLGLPDAFHHHYGSQDSILGHYGVTAAGAAA